MKAQDSRAAAGPLTAFVFAAALTLLLGGCENLFTYNIFGGRNDPSEGIENKIAFELSGASEHNDRYVCAFIDVDGSCVADGPNSGDYVFDPSGSGHATVTVDGNTTVTAVYPGDFVAVP